MPESVGYRTLKIGYARTVAWPPRRSIAAGTFPVTFSASVAYGGRYAHSNSVRSDPNGNDRTGISRPNGIGRYACLAKGRRSHVHVRSLPLWQQLRERESGRGIRRRYKVVGRFHRTRVRLRLGEIWESRQPLNAVQAFC
jgi:hypothetical protein